VFVCGTNGESYACSSEERRAVLEAWMNTPEVLYYPLGSHALIARLLRVFKYSVYCSMLTSGAHSGEKQGTTSDCPHFVPGDARNSKLDSWSFSQRVVHDCCTEQKVVLKERATRYFLLPSSEASTQSQRKLTSKTVLKVYHSTGFLAGRARPARSQLRGRRHCLHGEIINAF
jgi:hypothetical protein